MKSMGMAAVLAVALAVAVSMVRGVDEHGHDGHGHDDQGHDEHGTDEQAHDEHGTVSLSAAELAEFGIELATAGPGMIARSLELPGEVHPNDDRLAHIVPRYSGIVTDVRATIGDYVKQGQVLAVIESDESLAPFEVKTLISGTVIGKHITLGEAASRERDAFVIADLSSVWIDLTVYQRDLGLVRVGQEVQVYRGHDVDLMTGVISYITPIVDEQTRTATARVVLPNANKTWRPGMFVTGRVLVERGEAAIVVPESAIFTFEGESVVFVDTPEGFRPAPVALGRRGDGLVTQEAARAVVFEVVSGLAPGDRYVAEGGFTLKAELEKGSFGHGHAH